MDATHSEGTVGNPASQGRTALLGEAPFGRWSDGEPREAPRDCYELINRAFRAGVGTATMIAATEKCLEAWEALGEQAVKVHAKRGAPMPALESARDRIAALRKSDGRYPEEPLCDALADLGALDSKRVNRLFVRVLLENLPLVFVELIRWRAPRLLRDCTIREDLTHAQLAERADQIHAAMKAFDDAHPCMPGQTTEEMEAVSRQRDAITVGCLGVPSRRERAEEDAQTAVGDPDMAEFWAWAIENAVDRLLGEMNMLRPVVVPVQPRILVAAAGLALRTSRGGERWSSIVCPGNGYSMPSGKDWQATGMRTIHVCGCGESNAAQQQRRITIADLLGCWMLERENLDRDRWSQHGTARMRRAGRAILMPQKLVYADVAVFGPDAPLFAMRYDVPITMVEERFAELRVRAAAPFGREMSGAPHPTPSWSDACEIIRAAAQNLAVPQVAAAIRACATSARKDGAALSTVEEARAIARRKNIPEDDAETALWLLGCHGRPRHECSPTCAKCVEIGERRTRLFAAVLRKALPASFVALIDQHQPATDEAVADAAE